MSGVCCIATATTARTNNTRPHVRGEAADAVHYLTDEKRAQFVLLKPGEHRPWWNSWPHRFPDAARVLDHLEAGHGVAIVPCTIGTTALDVDEGDPARIIRAHPPLTVLRTRRGSHLYYRDEAAGERGNGPFESLWFEVRGDLRGAPGGILRLDHDPAHVVKLADSVCYGPDRWHHPGGAEDYGQGVLFHAQRCAAPGVIVPGGSGGTPAKLEKAAHARARVALAEVAPGGRNPALFRALSGWSVAAEVGGSFMDWQRAVERQAFGLNATFPAPLPPAEARDTARSVAGWRWRLPAAEREALRAAFFRERQAEVGRIGGRIGGRISRRGPDPTSERSTRPWEPLGVSRATYYRRKGAGRETR